MPRNGVSSQAVSTDRLLVDLCVEDWNYQDRSPKNCCRLDWLKSFLKKVLQPLGCCCVVLRRSLKLWIDLRRGCLSKRIQDSRVSCGYRLTIKVINLRKEGRTECHQLSKPKDFVFRMVFAAKTIYCCLRFHFIIYAKKKCMFLLND